MVSPGVYSRKTLNDNWIEDRYHSEDFLTATGNIHKKCARKHETDLAYIGERYDVLSRISRMPPRQSYATPEDGFNEKGTTHKGDFLHPRKHAMYASKRESAPALINTANAPVCPPEKRELKGPESGFGAGISRHPKDHDQRHFSTSHGDFFGSAEGGRKRLAKRDPSQYAFVGLSSEHEETKGSGMKCGKLCGENHCESHDPGRDTCTQRSWMPGGDPALKHIEHGGFKKPLPKQDNHLSLALGDGAMSKIRNDLKQRQGRLTRNGTTITKGAHMKAGYAIFQDD